MTRMTRVTQKGHPGKISLSVISMYLAFPEDRSKLPTQNMHLLMRKTNFYSFSPITNGTKIDGISEYLLGFDW